MKEIFDYLIANFTNIIKQLNIEQLIEILCAVISGIGLMVILSKLKEKNGNKETNRKSTEK